MVMMRQCLFLFLVSAVFSSSSHVVATTAATATAVPETSAKEEANTEEAHSSSSAWDDLDKRPLADWYKQAKFGIFVHWGVFSVPAFGSEWFEYYWQKDETAKGDQYRKFVQWTERPNFAYADYAHRFTAQFYQPDDWADVFAQSGAQYVVLTSKHHDGFCNWDSGSSVATTWNWNAMDIGPRRDLVGDLATAIRNVTSPHTKRNIKFGLYHSLYEWFNPLYLQDKRNNFTTQHFVDSKTLPELYDLVNKYQPELIWSDGDWEAPSSYWKATEFLHWYATQSSVKDTAVWNDRWGNDALCHHGAYLTCDDRYNPGKYDNATKKWENALTLDKTSWGYNRNASYSDYLTVTEIIHELIQVVAWNGNMLLNVGPAADGTIHPIFVDRLLQIGEWLRVNGRAIYDSTPWTVCQNETNVGVYYTIRNESLFAHVTKWPSNNVLELKCPQPTAATRITMLGLNETAVSSPIQHGISWSFLSKTKATTPTKTTTATVLDQALLPKRRNLSVGGDHSLQQQQQQQQQHVLQQNVDSSSKYSHDTGIVIQLPALTPDIIPCQHAWVLELSHIANYLQ